MKGETGVIYEETMDQHRNLWYPEHFECPQRFTHIIKRCEELNLLSQCKRLKQRPATKEEITQLHDESLYNLFQTTSGETNENILEEYSSNYDSIYVHPSTFDLAKISVGSTIELVQNIVNRVIQNGMAIIRPPGHHAMKSEHNGYCFFNNVAISANYALEKLELRRILIVDWDVHHGQGTQRIFYNDPRVLYFSIHRFENGSFWPFLKESDYDYVGEGKGKGFNFNVPLNKTGMKNEDYLAIFQQLLLPVAVEFNPELVIVSCGFDAATGCPEGEMQLTPAIYSHLTHFLMNLADGKVAVVLEGGYCLESLAEGAALTLRTLLGYPCPILVEPVGKPSQSIQESILNCIYTHRRFWKCLNVQETYVEEEFVENSSEFHRVKKYFRGDLTGYPTKPKYQTRDTCPQPKSEHVASAKERLMFLKLRTDLTTPKNVVSVLEGQIKLKEVFERLSYVTSTSSLIEDIKSFVSRSGICHDSFKEIFQISSSLFTKIAVIDFDSSEGFENVSIRRDNPDSIYFHVSLKDEYTQSLQETDMNVVDISLRSLSDMECVLIMQQIILPINSLFTRTE